MLFRHWDGAIALAVGVAALCAGCATSPIPAAADLSAGRAADAFAARSFADPALHQFLAQNLGRDPGTPAWDFEALSWVAFYYHPSLAVARAQWATARAAETTARARPNPTLTLTPGYSTTREAGVSPWLPAINLDFLFPTNGKRARQQDIARAETEAARLGVFTALWQVRGDLRRALADAESAGRRAAVLRAQADGQRRLLTLLEQRFTAGSAAAADVSTTRGALLRAEAAAADAESQAGIARARVAASLGLPLSALDGVKLPAPPFAPVLSESAMAAARREALQSRADVLAALARYGSAQAALELEIARRMPDFHLGPGYQYDQGVNKWTLALTLELPVFNRNEGPIAEAAARRAEATAQFNLVQAQAIAAIDAAVAAQSAAARQLERATQLRGEVQQQNDLVQQRMRLGGADAVEVETARLDLTTVEGTILDAQIAMNAAAGQLEDALQLPFPHLATLAARQPDTASLRHE